MGWRRHRVAGDLGRRRRRPVPQGHADRHSVPALHAATEPLSGGRDLRPSRLAFLFYWLEKWSRSWQRLILDPTFTADNETDDDEAARIKKELAPDVANLVRRNDPDVLAVHDQRIATSHRT